MVSLSRIETRTQEVTTLTFFIAALSVMAGGLFYLFSSPQLHATLTGHTGTHWLAAIFNAVGYATFYLALLFIYLGRYLTERVSEPKDLLNLGPSFLYQFSLQLFALVIIASSFTVIDAYFSLGSHSMLKYGPGGQIGVTLGGNLYAAFGIYGSTVFLFSLSLLVGIFSGVIHLVSLLERILELLRSILKSFNEISANLFDKLIQLTGMDPHWLESTLAKIIPGLKGKLTERHQAASLPEDHPEFYQFHSNRDFSKSSESDSHILNTKDRGEVVSLQNKTAPVGQVESSQSLQTSENLALAPSSEPELTQNPEPEEDAILRVLPWKKRYSKPEVSLLSKGKKQKKLSQKELRIQCQNLEERLKSFQIKGKVLNAHVGVRLTMYEFQPEPGIKLSKILSLSDDLALLLGASSIRILAPIPGKTTVGIEVPNETPTLLAFSDLMKKVQTEAQSKKLPIAVGKNVYDDVIVEDIAKMPHLLVSGTTGSGKSVFMNTLISSLLFTRSPKELRFLMIDPKMIELTPYNGIPHLLRPVVTDLDEAKDLLVWAEEEMDRRYQTFSLTGSRNIDSFNEKVKSGKSSSKLKATPQGNEPMPYIVIVIDELADLMITQGKDVEIPITRIAQKARAAGIHLVIATQRPSSDIVTGLIKTNFPTRVSFKVSSAIDSRTIIDTSGAEKLLGNGDLLYMPNGKALERIQASFLDEGEVKKIVRSTQK